FLVPLVGKFLTVESDTLQEGRVELRFDAPDRHMTPIGAFVHVVPGCPGVQIVGAALVGPGTAVTVLQHHRHEQGAAVDHGGVHHLTPVGGLAFDEGTEDAGDHEHGAPGEVAEEVDRGDRGTTRAAQGVQGAVHGDVVHVVSGTEGEGTVLSPAGDPRVNEARVEGQGL